MTRRVRIGRFFQGGQVVTGSRARTPILKFA